MTRHWKQMILAASMVLCAGCSSESAWESDDEYGIIRLEVVHPAQTRVTDTGFENKDRIGVFMVKNGGTLQPGGNELNNEQFSYNGSTWTSARKLYWNEGSHDIYAYYPYNATVADTEDYTFSISTDQSAAEDADGMSGYEASDFLWASATAVSASASPVKLTFSHRMSKAVIKLEKSAEYDGEIPDDVQVFIHNTVTKASIDLSTGGVSKDSYAGTSTIKARKTDRTTFCACVVPQNIESRRPLVEVVTQGVSYLMEGKISFKQGYQHTLTITLSKNPDQTKIEIGGGISGWN